MKKLLHERLRELKGHGCSELASLAGVSCQAYCVSDACHKDIYKAISDEIEKYYDPKPRDPEGNPVHDGMEVEGGVVSHWSVFEDGSWAVFDSNYNEIQCGDKNEPIRLPKPKILDADGVEINVGDTIYSTQTGVKLTVIEMINQNGHDLRVRFDDGTTSYAMGKLYTHREPDSLEKLRDDMIDLCGTDGEDSSLICDELADCAARLTALIERGA